MSRSKPPLTVWTATALHVGVMIIFTLLYPAYWGFDETGHVSRVLGSQHGDLYPTPGVAAYVVGVNDTYQMFNIKDQPPFITYVPLPRADRPSFDSLGGGTSEPEPAAVPNQLAQHPPGYYALAAGVLDAIPGSAHLAWDQTVGLLRLLDILFLLPLPYLCWAIAKRYTRSGVAVATAFAPILLPAFERLGGSVNNDDLLILLTSIFLLQVAKAMDGDTRIRVAMTMGISLTLALLTKGFALVLPPIAVLAYLVAWRRNRTPFPQWPVRIVVLAGAIGGLWWLRNLNVYGSVQPAGLTRAQANVVWPPLPHGTHEHVATYLHHSLDRMTTDVWGALGLTVPPSLPGWITFVASALAVALILLAFVATFAGRRVRTEEATGRHAGPGPRVPVVDLLVLLLPTVLVMVPLLFHGWSDYSRTGQLIGIQGRYLYPGFVGLVAIAAVGADLIIGLLPSAVELFLPAVTCVLSIAIEVTAGCVVLSKLWLRKGSTLSGNISTLSHAVGTNSPWPGIVTIAMLAFVFVSALAALAAVMTADRDTTDTSSESLVPAESAP
jgi:4-amino-4-deoxy-L-arabinose transferase-like glycosyltransferase